MSKLFKRYDSITNSYSEKFIEGIRERGFDTGVWVAQEKIHGCFKFNTPILLPNGDETFIGALVESNYSGEVLGVDEKGELVATKVTNVYNNGPKENWVKVTMQSFGGKGGRTRVLRVTDNHEFFVNGTYKPVKDLSVGCELEYSHQGLKLSYIQEQMLLGLKLGGNLTLRSISSTNLKYLQYVSKALADLQRSKITSTTSGYGSLVYKMPIRSCREIEETLSDYEPEP